MAISARGTGYTAAEATSTASATLMDPPRGCFRGGPCRGEWLLQQAREQCQCNHEQHGGDKPLDGRHGDPVEEAVTQCRAEESSHYRSAQQCVVQLPGFTGHGSG